MKGKMKGKMKGMMKKGFESPTDMTELFIGIILVAIGLAALFLPASCQKQDRQAYFDRELLLLDHGRDFLFLLQEPLGSGSVADQLILGEFGDGQKTLAEKRLEVRMEELMNDQGVRESWMTLKISGSRELYDDEQNLLQRIWYKQMLKEFQPQAFPSVSYLPSLDGSVIMIEKKSNIQNKVKLA